MILAGGDTEKLGGYQGKIVAVGIKRYLFFIKRDELVKSRFCPVLSFRA